jgi:Etoposide-induced protein 2.4 (EI24)
MLNELISGARDSCNYYGACRVLVRCRGSHKPLFLSTWLTGFLFLGSLGIYTWGIEPLLKEYPRFEKVFNMLYHLLWLFPLYLTSFILNIFCYSDISIAVYRACRGKPKSSALSFSRMIACEVHRGLIMGVYVILMSLLSIIPYSQPIILSLLSWLYSFYCFEYRWVLEGKTINKEISKLEHNAIYYLGFGLPFALITYGCPGLFGSGIWALLFPIFMVTAILSLPPETPTVRVPVFKAINKLCDKIEVLTLGDKF